MQIDAVERRSGRAYARLFPDGQEYRGSSSPGGATAGPLSLRHWQRSAGRDAVE
jgi:hypothetical protein